MVYGRVLPTDRSDVQMCLSMIVSWVVVHTSTLVVVGALILKRWIVQYVLINPFVLSLETVN